MSRVVRVQKIGTARFRRAKHLKRELPGGLLFYGVPLLYIFSPANPARLGFMFKWPGPAFVGVLVFILWFFEFRTRRQGVRPWPIRRASWIKCRNYLIGIVAFASALGFMGGWIDPLVRGGVQFSWHYAIDRFEFAMLLFFHSVLVATANERALGLGILKKDQFPFWMGDQRSPNNEK